MRKLSETGGIWLWLVVCVILADQLSKHWALDTLSLSESLRILPVLNFTLAYNTGAAFSMLHQAAGWQNVFLCSLAFIVSGGITYKLFTMPRTQRCMALSLALIMGGALGNAWDRIQHGFVIDFIHFHLGSQWHFAIFNIADSAISIGAFLLIACWFFEAKETS